MATRPTPRRDTKTIPAPPKRLPEYVPLPPPTGLGGQPETLPEEPGEAGPVEPLHTIADEQRQRSEEIQRMGVTAYMAQFDTRDPEAQQQPVAGVQHRKVEEYETRGGRR